MFCMLSCTLEESLGQVECLVCYLENRKSNREKLNIIYTGSEVEFAVSYYVHRKIHWGKVNVLYAIMYNGKDTGGI